MTDIEWMRKRYGGLDPLKERWKAQPENTIGGWCVTLAAIPGTPADCNPPIVDFCTEEHATHVAEIHNEWLES